MAFRRTWLSILIGMGLTACGLADEPAELGNAAFEAGRYTEAVIHYREALQDEPAFAVQANLGHAYMKLERWTEAAASYRAAIALDPNAVTVDLRLFLSQACYQDEKYEAALDAFVEATAGPPDRRTGIWIARCLIELEQWLRARAALLACLASDPRDLETLELLAHVCGQLDDPRDVIDAYRELLAVEPNRTAYRVALANALALAGRHQDAIETLELAWRLDRGAAEKVNRLLADLYLTEQMPHEAALCYTRVVRDANEPGADDYFRLATAYFQSDEFRSAQAALERMRQLDPNDRRTDLYLAHIALETDQDEKAERHFQAALAKAPNATDALLALAQLEMEHERYDEAAGHFAAAIDAGDDRPQVHRNRLLALVHLPEQTERTTDAFKAALAQHPADASLQRLLDRYLHPSGHPHNGERDGASK